MIHEGIAKAIKDKKMILFLVVSIRFLILFNIRFAFQCYDSDLSRTVEYVLLVAIITVIMTSVWSINEPEVIPCIMTSSIFTAFVRYIRIRVMMRECYSIIELSSW